MLKTFANGHSLLEFQLIRLKKAFPFSPIVVATSTSTADQEIEDIARINEVGCYRGDEQDVLGRFVNCCHYFHFTDYVIRICADNPFLQPEFLRELMRESAIGGGVDYISYAVDDIPAIRTHFGFFAELVKFAALERVNKMDVDPVYREHVTSYIYEHGGAGGGFGVRWLAADLLAPYLDSIRLTVDTMEDFDNAVAVYKGVTSDDWKSIVTFVDGHPATKANMEKQIRLHRK